MKKTPFFHERTFGKRGDDALKSKYARDNVSSTFAENESLYNEKLDELLETYNSLT